MLLAENNRLRLFTPDCSGFSLRKLSLDWLAYLPGHFDKILDNEETLARLG